MKKIYMELELDVILFTAEDIVTLSDNQKDDVLGDIFD